MARLLNHEHMHIPPALPVYDHHVGARWACCGVPWSVFMPAALCMVNYPRLAQQAQWTHPPCYSARPAQAATQVDDVTFHAQQAPTG